MKYFVYILYNFAHKRFYTGFTTDLAKRLKEHKRSKLSHRNINFEPIFIEVFKNEKDARRRERYLKSSKGKFTLKAMLKETIKDKRP